MDRKIVVVIITIVAVLVAGAYGVYKLGSYTDSGSTQKCGIENCHGLDIQCGPNEAEVCTEIYEIGDKCRQYAQCGVVEGECKQIESQMFENCKACVEDCIEEHGDGEDLFECESNCE